MGCFLTAFNHIGIFLKIVLPCRRELKNQGPRVTENVQKSNKNCIRFLVLFWKAISQQTYTVLRKNGSQMGPKLNFKLEMCAGRTPQFHPWVDKVPKWCQMAPKVVARVAKSCQNGSKRLPKVFKIWVQSPSRGGLSSKVYPLYITCSDKGDRKASKNNIVGDRH